MLLFEKLRTYYFGVLTKINNCLPLFKFSTKTMCGYLIHRSNLSYDYIYKVNKCKGLLCIVVIRSAFLIMWKNYLFSFYFLIFLFKSFLLNPVIFKFQFAIERYILSTVQYCNGLKCLCTHVFNSYSALNLYELFWPESQYKTFIIIILLSAVSFLLIWRCVSNFCCLLCDNICVQP